MKISEKFAQHFLNQHFIFSPPSKKKSMAVLWQNFVSYFLKRNETNLEKETQSFEGKRQLANSSAERLHQFFDPKIIHIFVMKIWREKNGKFYFPQNNKSRSYMEAGKFICKRV